MTITFYSNAMQKVSLCAIEICLDLKKKTWHRPMDEIRRTDGQRGYDRLNGQMNDQSILWRCNAKDAVARELKTRGS